MDSRQRQDLDNYITGHYGEDQFERSEFWPEISAHQEYWERHTCAQVYEYDPTDDGPEVEIVARIKAAHPLTWDPALNRAALELSRGAADWLFTTLAVMKIEEHLQ